MAFVPVTFAVQAEFRYTQSGEQTENTLYFLYVSDPSITDMNTLASSLYTWWGTNLKPIINTLTMLRQIYLTNLTSNVSPTVTYVPSSGNVGTATGSVLPNNACLAIAFLTNGRGRSSRGRNYSVGMVEPQLGAGGQTASASYISDLEDAYNVLPAALPPDWEWVAVSRYTNNAPRTIGLAQPIIAASVRDTALDSQRRRLPGRGT